MPNAEAIRIALQNGSMDPMLSSLYPHREKEGKERILEALSGYEATFGKGGDLAVFSAPGRTEIGGNHTDHNHGRVLAGSVDLDILAVAEPTEDGVVSLCSRDFPEDRVDVANTEKRPSEEGTSASLIRGVAAGLKERGFLCGGFRAYTLSRVPAGSGVSSSAAFEVLLGTVQNHFYNHASIPSLTLAQIAQFAEREYFGKPCGLMDQAACATGGVCMMDFARETEPVITPVSFSPEKFGLSLCLVSPGGSHADLTALYAAIPERMAKVAAYFGKRYLNELGRAEFFAALPQVRKALGDDAVLAALHFLRETDLVPLEAKAMEEGDVAGFLALVNASGHSSFESLRNVYIPLPDTDQSAAIALDLAGEFLRGRGACRIHGGGFGGTVQCFVPTSDTEEFSRLMEAAFGRGCCRILSLRPFGPLRLI